MCHHQINQLMIAWVVIQRELPLQIRHWHEWQGQGHPDSERHWQDRRQASAGTGREPPGTTEVHTDQGGRRSL